MKLQGSATSSKMAAKMAAKMSRDEILYDSCTVAALSRRFLRLKTEKALGAILILLFNIDALGFDSE